MSKEKVKRNQKFYELYLKGYAIRALERRFRIAHPRGKYIIKLRRKRSQENLK